MVALFAASAVLFSSLAGQVPQAQQANMTPSLVVTGSAETRVSPDLASLTAGITTQAKTAKAAQDEANTKAADFIARAKKLLGDKGTVQTGSINLSPVYSEPGRQPADTFVPQIVGYRADDTLSIRTTDFTLVGPVIDAAVDAGLNNISSVDFGLQDDTNARLDALSNAVKQARKKAEAMAAAAGVDLGGIWEISEQGARVMPFEAQPMMAARAGGAPTPVEPGAVVVNGDVTIKFFIREKT